MFRKLYKWLLKLFLPEKFYSYQFVDDVPGKLKPDTIYLVGNQGYFWQSVMLCPCGCQQILYMNLMDDYHPYWKYTIQGRNISLSPSVDRLVGCRSHFFLRNGKIDWC